MLDIPDDKKDPDSNEDQREIISFESMNRLDKER